MVPVNSFVVALVASVQVTGRRAAGRTLRLSPDHVLIVEGIHGLNPRLVPDFPAERIFRIYASALTQLNLDRHNRVPTTDTRLIRRIVREYDPKAMFSVIDTREVLGRGFDSIN